jgi:glycosyltransferase involved in cell wall biosynthesis
LSQGKLRILREAFSDVQAVIALSPDLKQRADQFHPNVFFIPNGLDLHTWGLNALLPRHPDRPFRVGMAAATKTAAQRHVKGLDLARNACELADVELLVVGRGAKQIPHRRMIEDFYSQIDVLIHPVGPGKEASSNVIMECLALGIPVITTRDAGFHGQALKHGLDALIVDRNVKPLSTALVDLKNDGKLRVQLGSAGREFAEKHHDIRQISQRYERVFKFALGMELLCA